MFEATEEDVRVAAQKKLRDCHQLRYLAAEKNNSTLCVASQVEGADKG
jgi:hypothetical protein